MRVYKSAFLSIALIVLILSFMLSVTSNYTFSVTGQASLARNTTVFSLSLTALIIVVFAALHVEGYSSQNEKEKHAMELVKKIKNELEYYGGRKKVDFKEIQKAIIVYARELLDRYPYYLDNLGSLGVYLRQLAISSNLKKHGHFKEKRGEDYIEGMYREFGIYHILKGKIR